MTDKMSAQVFGLEMLAATFAVFVPVAFVFLDTGSGMAALVGAVVLSGSAYLVWRFGTTWAKVLGLIVTIAAAATGTIYNVYGIAQVFSPIEFVTGLMTLFGFLFALIGGIVGLFRRGERSGSRSGDLFRGFAIGAVGVGAAVSIVGFVFTREAVAEANAADAVMVGMANFEFLPEDVSMPRGGTLLFDNGDAWAHDVVIEDHGISERFGPGSRVLVDVSALPAGTYDFHCSLHTFDGEGMTGTLTVGA